MQYQTIGKLAGAVNTSNIHAYEFIHTTSANNTYYRIRQVDTDGRSSYSQVIRVSRADTEKITVYHDPSTGNALVNIQTTAAAPVQLLLCDGSGRILLRRSVQVAPGTNSYRIEMKQHPGGSYVLMVASGTRSQGYPFVK